MFIGGVPYVCQVKRFNNQVWCAIPHPLPASTLCCDTPPPVPACGSATRLGTGSVSRSLAPLHHTIQRSSNVCTSHQHSISHIAACTSRHALLYPPSPCLCTIRATLPEMVVERGIVENHSVACILIKRTNASSLCGASYALWKSQGWLKAALVALHLL